MQKVQFLDTTLRDGEQTPGVNFNTQEKVQLALQLEKWGVDVIEAGFPIASTGDFEAVKAIAEKCKQARIGALARLAKEDIDRAYEALKDAQFSQLHVFIATSPIHREYKLKMSQEEILDSVKTHVTYAASLFEEVQFSPEDATRTEWDFLAEVIQTAIECGATVINIPDTVGYTNPTEFANLFKYLQEHVNNFNEAIFSSHCHDDLGMAVANALAAFENGALRVEGTVNGIGERAGNTALEEVAVALHIRQDIYPFESNINLKETKRTSDLVSRLSGMPVPRNKAIIGANAYAHESGIHQDGVLKNPETYEIITPQLVGIETNQLPLGKLSGRHAFIERMKSLNYDMSDEKEVADLFGKFKDLADRKKKITNADLHALYTGKKIEETGRYELVQLTIQIIDESMSAATVAVYDRHEDNQLKQATATSSGIVDAVYTAINSISDQQVILQEYKIDAVTEGIDAQAEVHVTVVKEDGFVQYGTGIDHDVVRASAKAYLQALD